MGQGRGGTPAYRLGKAKRGPITAAVAATGTLSPVAPVTERTRCA
jgi:hypothetical protein